MACIDLGAGPVEQVQCVPGMSSASSQDRTWLTTGSSALKGDTETAGTVYRRRPLGLCYLSLRQIKSFTYKPLLLVIHYVCLQQLQELGER